MLLAGNAERHRFGAGGEQDMAAFEHSCADGHRVATGEAGAAVVSIDALLSKARLPGLWHRLGEAALEAHKRSEEHTSELQSLMRISYAVFCLKKKKKRKNTNNPQQ